MPKRMQTLTSKPVISSTEAQLFVADIEASCNFFAKLGFEIVFVYGKPPFYAQVKRDRGLIDLRHVDHPLIEPALRDREIYLSATLTIDTHAEIEALFAEFEAAGVTFAERLRLQPWGAASFIVKDPDGNLLLFAGPAA